mgnify:FL=1
MDEKQSVPLWISDFLFCDVFSNAVDDVSCVFRSRKSASGSYLVMDLEASVELGVSCVNVSPGIAQFAFGFYSVMLTSTVLGFVTMLLFKPRFWCVYCPMGTMTQLICKGKNKRALSDFKN